MKLVSLIFLGLGFSLSSTGAGAADATTCPDRLERHGSIQLQQSLSNNNVCFVSVGNFKTEGGIYRNYLFTSDGELMVFNSYGWGEDSDSTGAREYFFFPRTADLSFNWNTQSRQLEITAVSGDQFFFGYEDAQLASMSKAQVKLAPEVNKTNKGGVEILKYQGLLMDGGFRIGSAPTSNRGGSSTFRDAAGASCTVKNTALFKYESDGDLFFKYTDKELSVFLKRVCSKLQF